MKNKTGLYAGFPETPHLLAQHEGVVKNINLVNGHIHTPNSFSAFINIEQAFQMATKEGVSVLGINDFYTTAGFEEFAAVALKYRIYPLFNIEFMALQKKDQEVGIRINDPVNPGRTYMSGKGLSFPAKMGAESTQKLSLLQIESNRQTYEMVNKLNEFLETTQTGLHFNAAGLQKQLAKNLFRERHIASAIRIAVSEKFPDKEQMRLAYQTIFSGKFAKASFNDIATLENEIRNNLLKSGGPAYVPEDEKAFLSLTEVNQLIIDAGGIPCYPVLLDNINGEYTDFEANPGTMLDTLSEKGIFMIELIPGRNECGRLKNFAEFAHNRGFIITFGTEHNTTQMDPLKVTCRGNIPLDKKLLEINYEGASIIAAHQYLSANGNERYPTNRMAGDKERKEFAKLGNAVISCFINNKNA